MHPMMRKRKAAYDDEEEELDDELSEEPEMGMDLGSELDSELDDLESESEDSTDPDLMSAAQAAFPDQDWDADRLAALKDFIQLCSSKDYGESDDKGDDAGLALVFGSPKKK